ncbi:GNAT family N-acetyltransferase [Streptomyces sp. NPDC005573]|uniref:GNAT family N-acetyltransferase n=1 Tax=unclassified Streptomyces TaxID=2593676 RepID=UPI0033B4110F
MTDDRVTGVLVIRTALPAEAEAVAGLHQRARSAYCPDGAPQDGAGLARAWLDVMARADGQVLCAVEKARIVGAASFRTPDGSAADTVGLFQLHVDPGRWRAGIGTALHAACVEQWRADGRRSAVLELHADNLRTRAFCARQGWVPDPADPPARGGSRLRLRYAVPGA